MGGVGAILRLDQSRVSGASWRVVVGTGPALEVKTRVRCLLFCGQVFSANNPLAHYSASVCTLSYLVAARVLGGVLSVRRVLSTAPQTCADFVNRPPGASSGCYILVYCTRAAVAIRRFLTCSCAETYQLGLRATE